MSDQRSDDSNLSRNVDVSSNLTKTVSIIGTYSTVIKMFLTLIGGLIVAAGSGYAWASTLAPKIYVDEQLRVNAAVSAAVDNDHDKRLAQIDIRLEKVVTTLEHQSKLNDDVLARMRELESRNSHTTMVIKASEGK